MNAKELEEMIRTSAPADVFAGAFSRRIGRDTIVKRDSIIIQEIGKGYIAKRRIEISAKVYDGADKNDFLVQQEYNYNPNGSFTLKTRATI